MVLPLIIAGPCSAESQDQVMKTASAIAQDNRICCFRAGIWKPRTRPNSFEGVGEVGLKWLQQVKAETGLLTTIEVANAGHVELALKYGIDILWIGARTSVNPFSIQEIANVLVGVDVPVLVKNPINPDLSLWVGALERLNMAGITKLGAIHRGFSSGIPNPYRNAPMWEIPIELKRLIPELPMLTDPSHIAGNRPMLKKVAQKALDLEMDGLMIESHPDPDNAKSDPLQQITPDKLSELLTDLILRLEESNNPEFENKLSQLRDEIDQLDENLLEALAARMQAVTEIGEYKRDNNVTILQINRWDELMEDRIQKGKNLNLTTAFVQRMYELIHEASIQRQTEILNNPVRAKT